MQPLMEMFLNAQNGNALSVVQQKSGLDSVQAQKALSAILPAFSTGLKRQATNELDLEKFLSALSSGRHEKYADDPNTAFGKKGVKKGNGILGHLFGSKKLSRQIASSASKASGVDETTIKQLLPSLANMVMGGLFKQAKQQTPQQVSSVASEPIKAAGSFGGGIGGAILGQIVEQMMKKGSSGKRSTTSNNPLQDILEQMTGGGSSNSGGGNASGGSNPMGDAFREMLEGKKGGYRPEKKSTKRSRKNQNDYEQAPDDQFEDIGAASPTRSGPASSNPTPTGRSRPAKPERNGLEDLFGDMLKSGSDESEDYQSGIESIFDQFMKPKRRR